MKIITLSPLYYMVNIEALQLQKERRDKLHETMDANKGK